MQMFTQLMLVQKLNDSTEICQLEYKIHASAFILHGVWQACIGQTVSQPGPYG